MFRECNHSKCWVTVALGASWVIGISWMMITDFCETGEHRLVQDMEESLLARLSAAKGNLIDDTTLTNALFETKNASQDISKRMQAAVDTQSAIGQVCLITRPCARVECIHDEVCGHDWARNGSTKEQVIETSMLHLASRNCTAYRVLGLTYWYRIHWVVGIKWGLVCRLEKNFGRSPHALPCCTFWWPRWASWTGCITLLYPSFVVYLSSQFAHPVSSMFWTEWKR